MLLIKNKDVKNSLFFEKNKKKKKKAWGSLMRSKSVIAINFRFFNGMTVSILQQIRASYFISQGS